MKPFNYFTFGSAILIHELNLDGKSEQIEINWETEINKLNAHI
jgi:hypothetical protein